MNKRLITAALVLMILVSGLFAQTGDEAAPTTDSTSGDILDLGKRNNPFSMGLGIGAVTLDNKLYNSIQLTPDLSFGKFGLGLDLNFRFTFMGDNGDLTFDVYRPDWYLENGDFFEYLNLYLSKLNYVRYGQAYDPLYMRLGVLDGSYLGNGYITSGYTNTLFLPEKKVFGGEVRFDTALFDWPMFGIEFMTSSMARWDLFGGRFFVRPFGLTSWKRLNGMQIGFTAMLDNSPSYYFEDTDIDNNSIYDTSGYPVLQSDDVVFIYGVDIVEPIIRGKAFPLALTGDLVFQGTSTDPNLGGMVGIQGALFKFILYGLQLRFIGDDFIPAYFGRNYDLERMKNYQVYSNVGDPLIDAGLNYYGSLGFTFFNGGLTFLTSVDGPFALPTDSALDAPWQYPHLKAILYLKEKTIPVLDFSLWYDKQGIDSFESMFSPEQAVIGGQVNVDIQGAVISFIVDVKYDAASSDQWTVTSTISAGARF